MAERPRKERTTGSTDPDHDHDNGGIRSHDGNGIRNRTQVAVKSPTNNQGYQHTSSSNLGGSSSIQNALCKHVKVCNITLKVVVVGPGKVKKTAHTKMIDATPRKKNTPAAKEDPQDSEDECGC